MAGSKEPDRLHRGKVFHRKIQGDWELTAEGKITVEKAIRKAGGRNGRIDIHADTEGDSLLVAVVEVKGTDWDAMTGRALRRNVRRQVRQILDYVDSQLAMGKQVSPGVIFPIRPQTPGRLAFIEESFEDEGIPVVWDDETVEERRHRSESDPPA